MSIDTRPALAPEAKREQLIMAGLYLAAIVLGVVNGFYGTAFTHSVGDFVSSVFIKLFKFISIPIIAVSIISTLASISKSSESGRIFRHTIFYTLLTTILAALLAAGLYLLFSPANVALPDGATAPAAVAEKSYFAYVQSVIPDNFLAPFLSANVLSVLLIAAAIGLAIAKLPRESRSQEVLTAFFTACQDVLFILVKWLIKVLPVGIFGFISALCVELASGVSIGGLGTYFATVLTANFLQMLVVLPLVLLIRGLKPLRVARGMMPALLVAFFSKSSAGTLPVTMACSEERVGVRPAVARFVLPICTTINMNACAAFILITSVFLMQNAGAEITLGTLGVWVLIATIAAVGNAGVPMGCFFLTASLMASMNVPILLMGVILPVYAVIDMIETMLNVWSDSTVAAMVNKDLYGDEDEAKSEAVSA